MPARDLEMPDGERVRALLEAPSDVRPGSAILYLHGFGSSQAGEKAARIRRRAVEDGFAFASIDLRGHGASGGELSELTVSRALEDVAAARRWLSDLGWERVSLFGSSMGGALAFWHATLDPEAVDAVAAIAPAIGMGPALERWAGPAGLETWRREGKRRLVTELVEADLGWSLVEDLRRYPPEALADRFRTPAVVIQGKLDASVEWRDVARLAEALPLGQLDLRLVEDGDHRLLDHLDDFWEAARRLFETAAAGGQ